VKKNPLRPALDRGETVTGIILFTGNPMIVELAAAAGVDFVIIDMEHSPLDLDRCAHVIRAADAAGIAPLVRVPDVDAGLIMKVLDLGAAGIVLAHADREKCQAALAAVRYAPEGGRGACPIARSADYAPGDWNTYTRAANREVMLVPLLEEKEVIADFDALAAMPGIEAYFVGPTDLGVSLGVPSATFDDPLLGAALDQVVAAATRHGKRVMTTIGNNLDPAYGRSVAKRGVQMIVLGTDGHLFLDACRRMNQVKRDR
jgi:4-hydroxy-2-oxoheptanedioate aldolase